MTGRRDHPWFADDGAPHVDRLTLIVPGDPDQPTGGYRYDARVAAELRELGRTVDVVGLPGRFPDPDDEARAALDDALSRLAAGNIALIDGLALGGLPEVAERHRERLALVGLVHHPLADETGLADDLHQRFLQSEPRALAACRRIVTTSEFTARRLAALGVPGERIRIVPPGVDSPPAGDDYYGNCCGNSDDGETRDQRLLCVASLVPRKGQDLLVEALADLVHFPWRLELVGDPDRNPDFAAAVRAAITANGLDDRIRIFGVQDQTALDRRYRAADVLVVPSHYEGFGMVVTEALTRAVPVIATTGGALADTVPPQASLQVPPGDRKALSSALRRWLTEPKLRAAKAEGARLVRPTLADWPAAGRRFAEALDSIDRI